jgi:hypothetical protein
LIKFLVKAELGKLQKTWDQFLIQSGFEKEKHSPASQSHGNIVKPDQETPSNVGQSTTAKKGKRAACLKTPDEPVKATSTSQQTDAGSSHILGGGKHPFPFSQKTYSKRAKRLAEPRVSVEDQQPVKKTIEFEDPVHLKSLSQRSILMPRVPLKTIPLGI